MFTYAHACTPQAFNVIDTNNDGFITREDLREILGSLCTSGCVGVGVGVGVGV